MSNELPPCDRTVNRARKSGVTNVTPEKRAGRDGRARRKLGATNVAPEKRVGRNGKAQLSGAPNGARAANAAPEKSPDDAVIEYGPPPLTVFDDTGIDRLLAALRAVFGKPRADIRMKAIRAPVAIAGTVLP